MSATLTKTAIRRINGQIRELQRRRNDTLAGRFLPWGVPYCKGPGSPYHQEPLCEGCCGRFWCEEDAGRLAKQIRQLQAQIAPPPVQAVLW